MRVFIPYIAQQAVGSLRAPKYVFYIFTLFDNTW